MKITNRTGRGATHRGSSVDLARGALTLSIAGALACLALPATTAHADQVTAGGGGASTSSRDIDDVVAERKTHRARDYVDFAAARSQSVPQRPQHGTVLAHFVFAPSRRDRAADVTCYLPETLDQWSRRLIAVQFCSKAHVVPADLPTLVPYGEAVPQAVGR